MFQVLLWKFNHYFYYVILINFIFYIFFLCSLVFIWQIVYYINNLSMSKGNLLLKDGKRGILYDTIRYNFAIDWNAFSWKRQKAWRLTVSLHNLKEKVVTELSLFYIKKVCVVTVHIRANNIHNQTLNILLNVIK